MQTNKNSKNSLNYKPKQLGSNRHPNIVWKHFLKSASKIDLKLKKWDVTHA